MTVTNRLLLLLCVVGLCAGCATAETVTRPTFEFTPDADISLLDSSKQLNTRFVAKDGIGKATQDNVTVEVSDLISSVTENDFTIKLQDIHTVQNYSVFPMLLVLKITNNTDHIVTLERTIVKIEDDKQNDYPMADTVAEAKKKALERICVMYETRDRNYRENVLADAKEKLNGKYKAEYDQFVADVRGKMAKGVEIRYPETRPGYHITTEGLNDDLKDRSPAERYKKLQADINKREKTSFAPAREKNISKASKDMDEKIPNNLKGVITSGVYQPINILPGRSEKVLVPFSKRKEDEIIKKVNIGIYDLPTKVNEAGVPTKRAKFNFEMVAVDTK